jgi:hypothetical protein
MFENIHDYRAAWAEIKMLSELQPSPTSDLGARLALLLKAIYKYEKRLFGDFSQYLRDNAALPSYIFPSGKVTVIAAAHSSPFDFTVEGSFGRISVDLYSSGELKEKVFPGDKLFIDNTTPYTYIAHGIRKLPETND